jgi:hypothetical protein
VRRGGTFGGRLCAIRTFFLVLDAEAAERADLGAELDRLVSRQVAEVLDLDLSRRIFVYGERVDHAHAVALAQLLQLGLDLSMELRRRRTTIC